MYAVNYNLFDTNTYFEVFIVSICQFEKKITKHLFGYYFNIIPSEGR